MALLFCVAVPTTGTYRCAGDTWDAPLTLGMHQKGIKAVIKTLEGLYKYLSLSSLNADMTLPFLRRNPQMTVN